MLGSDEGLRAALSGSYDVRHEIGRGGMALVYLARDLKHDRDVALKVVRPELASALDARRFDREVRIAAALSNPHVVPIFDSGAVDGYLYCVMPLVAGETLQERLDREGKLPLAQVLDIAIDLATALDHAHQRGVVHRDVKPGNVFITGGEALLSDFGLAVSLTSGDESDRLTSTRLAAGTTGFMSPEQLMQPEGVDWRSDVFCFGLILFECLTGRHPFGSRDSPGHPLAWMGREREEVDLDCPAELATFVYRCLEKEPELRGGERGALAEELRAIARTVGGTHVSGGTRGKWGWAAAAFATVALVAAIAWPRSDGAFPPVSLTEPVVTWSSNEFDGQIVPGRAEVSFISDRDGIDNVWAVPVGGGPERRVTESDVQVEQHLWSPSGAALVYLINTPRDGFYLRFVGEDGRSLRTVHLIEAVRKPVLVRWLGDVVYLAVGRDLWSVDAGTGARTQLTHRADLVGVDVRSDQERIVFSTSGDRDLWTSRLDGGNATRITDTPDFDKIDPCWLGDDVAYLSTEGGQVNAWRVHPGSGTRANATVGAGRSTGITCAPDGASILLDQEDERADIWMWSREDDREIRLTSDNLPELMASSSSGGRVVFQRRNPRLDHGFPLFDAGVFAAVLEGGALSDVRQIADNGFSPLLSPDGEWIVFMRVPDGAALPDLELADWSGLVRPISTDFYPAGFPQSAPVGDWLWDNVVWARDAPVLYYIASSGSAQLRIERAVVGAAGPEVDTVSTLPLQALPKGLLPSPGADRLAYLLDDRTRGMYEVHVIELATGDDDVIYQVSSEASLKILGWSSNDGPLVLIRPDSKVPTRAEPFLVDLDGSTRDLPVIEDAYTSFASLDRSRAKLLVPVADGDARSLHELRVDGMSGWTRIFGGFSFSGFEELFDGRLVYAKHVVSADVWNVTFEGPN